MAPDLCGKYPRDGSIGLLGPLRPMYSALMLATRPIYDSDTHEPIEHPSPVLRYFPPATDIGMTAVDEWLNEEG